MEPDTQPEPAFDEAISVLLSELPAPVQSFVKGPARRAVVASLSSKYRLHADQAGVFEISLTYMLLGALTPDEFVKKLTDSGIPAHVVQQITEEVNEVVFKKINAEELQTPVPATTVTTTPQEPKPAERVVPHALIAPTSPREELSSQQSLAMLPTTKPSVHDTPPAHTFSPPPVATVVSMPIQVLTPAVPALINTASTQLPESTPFQGATLRTMSKDMEFAHEHRHPEPMPYTLEHTISPVSQSVVAPVFSPQPTSQTPWPLPRKEAESVEPVLGGDKKIVAATVPPPGHRPINLITEYGKDPYREPTE